MSNELVDKAVRLFTYLSKTQKLGEKVISDVNDYRADGQVVWRRDVPESDNVHWFDEGPKLVTVDRVQRVTSPSIPASLDGWVGGDFTDNRGEPCLRETAVNGASLTDHPEVGEQFVGWLARWLSWAEDDRRRAAEQRVYDALFQAHVSTTQNPEERELVVGVGLLAWAPPGQMPIRRHVFTQRVAVSLSKSDGALSVLADESGAGFRAELDMLATDQFPTHEFVGETEASALAMVTHPLSPETAQEAATQVAHNLHAQGRYLDDLQAPPPIESPVVTWAPALILRGRPKQGLSQAMAKIAATIRSSGHVPAGLRPLLDPDLVPEAVSDPSPGALLEIGGDVFAPLPLNDVQRRVIERVDISAQTLVQGPPGTGKTHMAAALLAHLLAQGKRVLVTAYTDQALYEVRARLPQQIRPLAVSVIGASRDDMADLRVAVETISRQASDHDVTEAHRMIAALQSRASELGTRRQRLNRRLVEARADETRQRSVEGHYTGTLAELIVLHEADAARYAWVGSYVGRNPQVTLDAKERAEWLALVREYGAEEPDRAVVAMGEPLPGFPDPRELRDAWAAASQARSRVRETHAQHGRGDAAMLQALPDADLEGLRRGVVDGVDALRRARAVMVDWQWHVLGAALGAGIHRWRSLLDETTTLTDQLRRSGVLATHVEFRGPRDILLPMAETLVQFLRDGGEIKLDAAGVVKSGMFSPAVVRRCQPFFRDVRVDGRVPVNEAAVQRALDADKAERDLEHVQALWADVAPMDPRKPLHQRLADLELAREELAKVLDVAGALGPMGDELAARRLGPLNWMDYPSVESFLTAVDTALAQRDLDRSEADVAAADGRVRQILDSVPLSVRSEVDEHHWLRALIAALDSRDPFGYAKALDDMHAAHQRAKILARRRELEAQLEGQFRTLVADVVGRPQDEQWDRYLQDLDAACRWVRAGNALAADATDVNAVRAEITSIEDELRDVAQQIAARRAWNHAVDPSRLTPSARADLKHYAQLVKQLGKGTGKYAPQRRGEIRQALARCTGSVPVWIMPLYRIVEQLTLVENQFDVVLIDEASQAGLEATFLQFLAPKIVVIGDDKQVSPTVFADEQQYRDLAKQYLADFRYRDTWQLPSRSLFDEASMLYDSQLSLVEHRRCVPEIIGFSNRIAYEPSNMPLIPVRQFGADRLEPFRVVHVVDGVLEGRTNPIEARRLVDQLKICLDDPAYDGLSFGVMSLLGADQPKLIEKMLLDELDPQVWAERDLRVGTPAEFQGSERDVIFLTMVSSASGDTRLTALTRDTFVQRYNVAVSRAKDQVWLFHSVTLNDLPNPADMRHQLLSYISEVNLHGPELSLAGARAAAGEFTTDFQREVHRRVTDAGYAVVTNHEAMGHRIDLVVIGAATCLAVECEGGLWDGPQAYVEDLHRQRELERCGWNFFRVRESAYVTDPHRALAGLWSLLDELEIKTIAEQEATQAFEEAESGTSPASLEHLDDEERPVGVDAERERAEPVRPPISDPPDERRPAARQEGDTLPHGLPTYVTFDGALAHPQEGSNRQVEEGLMSIIDVEGPVTGDRLTLAYMAASGGRRGSMIERDLKNSLKRLIRRGEVLEEQLRNVAGTRHTTYRLPDQPIVRLRELGPRDLVQVPSRERIALMAKVLEEGQPESDEAALRQALRLYGRTSLTQVVRDALEPALEAARADLMED